MKTKIYISAFLLFFSLSLMAQSNHYYYYKGQKKYLTLDKSSADINVKNTLNKSSLRNSYKLRDFTLEDDNSLNKPSTYKYAKIIFQNKLTDVEYFEKLKLIKSRSDVRTVSPNFKGNNGKKIGMSDYLYVKLKKGSDYQTLISIASEKKVSIIEQNKFMPLWYTLRCNENTTDNTLQIANYFFETGLFSSAIPDLLTYNDIICANDDNFGDLWGLNNSSNPNIDINACDAWTITEGSGVNVAVLDQGIELSHNDLSDNISSLSYDTESNSSPSQIFGDHGVHCAGTIGAIKDNNLQVVGVAPKSTLFSISNSLGGNANSRIKRADGINWAVKNGVDIISNSWGSGVQYDVIDDAIDNALTNGRNGLGTIIVFAVGNDYDSPVGYPANYHPDILAVGSVTSSGSKSNFSNIGKELDIVAPGSSILSTGLNNSITTKSGTSMATPHVAGIAALILSVNSDLTVQEVNTIIESTAQKVGGYSYSNNSNRPNGIWNNEMGYGLVDAYAAVQMAQQTTCTEKPQITVELEPIGSNYVAVHMVGANGTDINSQCITSTTWQKISSSGGCYASFGGSGFDGLGHGNCNSWSVYAKITATNFNGTTTIYRTITPPAPDPCDEPYRIERTAGYNTYRIIEPCSFRAFSLSNNPNSRSIEKQEVRVYNHYGNLVFITNEIEFDISHLKKGIYFIKAYINGEIITHKIIR